MLEMDTDKDFFISYNKADREWAEWIAWQLEEEGYTTVIQSWDFSPGRNFVLEMDKATKAAKRTIAVLSPDYLKSGFTQTEWAAAFRRDPTGEQGLLLPVSVRSYDDPQGILGQIVDINLISIFDESDARKRLLAGVRRERAKPSSISFPVQHSIPVQPTFPGPRIERISRFSGIGSGTMNHGLGATPDFVMLNSSCGSRIWYNNLTSKTVTIMMDIPCSFVGIAIKFSQ